MSTKDFLRELISRHEVQEDMNAMREAFDNDPSKMLAYIAANTTVQQLERVQSLEFTQNQFELIMNMAKTLIRLEEKLDVIQAQVQLLGSKNERH